MDNIQELLKVLRIGVRGRKSHQFILFLDFKRAFDSVDRTKLMEILQLRLKDEATLGLITKLLLLQEISLPLGGKFWQ